MTPNQTPIIAISLFILSASVVNAETVYDVLFKTGMLSSLKAGDHIEYELTRENLPSDSTPSSTLMRIDVNESAELEIQRNEDDHMQFLGTFPQETGNPMNMYFLEQTIAIVAEETGGSGFYLRNKFKAALGSEIGQDMTCQGAFEAEDSCVVLRPSWEETDQVRLGRFSDLQIEAVLDENDPAWIVGMEAVVPGGSGDFVYKLEKREE